MHFRLSLVTAIVFGLALGGQTPLGQSGVTVPQPVIDKVAAAGSAQVIVGVRTGFVPEGNLATEADVLAQRDVLQVAVDAAMGRAAAAGVLVGRRFDTIPFFTATVGGASVAALAGLPEVASIEEDALDAPVLGQSAPIVSAPAAWAAGATGAGWNVAVLDSGVEKTHSFLAGRIVSEACYSNAGGNGTASGGTSVCPGGVFTSTAVGSGAPCSASIDGCFHGTHVAGIAAGANGTGGINGIAPGAGIIAVQVFTQVVNSAACGNLAPCPLSFVSDQVLGLERVLVLAGAGNANRVAAVNMSLGGGLNTANCDVTQASRKAAIDNLRSIGVATVIASGNNGFVNGVSAPACISTAVSVGSTTKSNLMSSFGNRRPGLIALLAPGSAINSSLLGNTFGSLNGTSMATPHVAGAWAVLKQTAPAASVTQVLAALQTTGMPINDPPSGGTYTRINVNAARQSLLSRSGGVPGPPGAPTVTGSGNIVQFNWTPPTTGDPPTGYTLIARLTPGGPIVVSLPMGPVLTTTLTAPNGSFFVSVAASNTFGFGPESPGVAVTVPILPPLPGPPQNLAVSTLATTVIFNWSPPISGGIAAGYFLVASASPGGVPLATLQVIGTSVTVPNVPPGTYFVRVVGVNAAGLGPPSNEVSFTIAGPQVPGAPTVNPAVVVGSTVNLSWTPPGSGGVPTHYALIASLTPGGTPLVVVNVGSTSISVPGVVPGTYFIRISAVNGVGFGPPSNEIVVVVS